MKKLSFIALLLAAFIALSHPAAAFSTEQSTAQNSDGSPKFADPDEQMPGFVVSPDGGNATNGVLSFGGGSNEVTLPSPADHDSGARAFDHAFEHQQDK